MHFSFTMELTRLGTDMAVFPSPPSIFLKLLVFWPIRTPTHFLSISQIPPSFQRAAHIAPGSSAVLEWPGGPVQLHKALFHVLSTFICFWPHWVFVAQAFSPGGIQVSHPSDFSCCSSQALEHRLNSDVAQKLSCFLASGINQDQGSNPCPLCWQADSNLWTTRECLLCPTWSDAHDSPGRQIFISLFYRCIIILSLP